MVQLGVVQAVKQMDGAGAGSRQAHPDLARELGMGASHERRAFFVARLDKLQFFVSSERADQPVNPVAGIAEHALHPPFAQPGQNKIGNGFQVDAPLHGLQQAKRAAIAMPGPASSPKCCAAPRFTNVSNNDT
ncbi:hypothetical protein G6F57_020400 [Rhizopus arrhizus]|nr:hypothetical protein G6F57_020400 [Rhizopus arrhizus]